MIIGETPHQPNGSKDREFLIRRWRLHRQVKNFWGLFGRELLKKFHLHIPYSFSSFIFPVSPIPHDIR